MVKGYTDGNGIAVFIAEEGTYSVSASKPGYATQTVKVTVNMDVTVEIMLQPIASETLVPATTLVGVGLIMLSLV